MAGTKADLDAAVGELKTAVGAVGQRISDKLAALAAANPDLSSEIGEIQRDTAALNALVPADTQTAQS